MKVKVVLLECVDEAEKMISELGAEFMRREDVRVVALDPQVRIMLKDHNIEALDTIRFFTNDEHHKGIDFCDRILKGVNHNFYFADELGVSKAYQNTVNYHVSFYVNHFVWILGVLSGIKRYYPEMTDLHCCVADSLDGTIEPNPYIQPKERFLGLLARDFCQKNRIKFHAITYRRSKLQTAVKFLILNLLQFVSGGISWLNFWIFRVNNKKCRVVIVPAVSYRMDTVLINAKKQYPDLLVVIMWVKGWGKITGECSRLLALLKTLLRQCSKKNDLVSTILSIDAMSNTFNDAGHTNRMLTKFLAVLGFLGNKNEKDMYFENIFIGEILTKKIMVGLIPEIARLHQTIKGLKGLFQELNPSLMMSMYSVGAYDAMGELANVCHIPSLNISHGTHVPPNNRYEQIENYRLGTSVILNSYEFVAVQTPWAEKFLNYYKDNRPRICSGPLLYSKISESDRLAAKNELDKQGVKGKILVHATTQKLRHGPRFHIVETMDEYFSTLADIVTTVNQLKGVYLIIRPHPSFKLADRDFRKLLPTSEKLHIMSTGPFAKVLAATDLLLSYSSTCIEEAIQNRIPVLLYDKWGRYNHFGAPEVRKVEGIKRSPAYYLSKQSLLSDLIKSILETFDTNLLSEHELELHKFPETYHDEFPCFFNRVLEGNSSS